MINIVAPKLLLNVIALLKQLLVSGNTLSEHAFVSGVQCRVWS